jgi:hypothetical protein
VRAIGRVNHRRDTCPDLLLNIQWIFSFYFGCFMWGRTRLLAVGQLSESHRTQSVDPRARNPQYSDWGDCNACPKRTDATASSRVSAVMLSSSGRQVEVFSLRPTTLARHDAQK